MKKWTVYGSATIGVCVTVSAETEEDAIEAAYDEFDGLQGYVGNGGIGDKLVGVNNSAVSLSVDGDYEFASAEVKT